MNDRHLTFSRGKINRQARNERYKNRSFVIWFTGLSGSGKSTLSQALEKYLFDQNHQSYVIDGDNLRHGLCSDLSFSPQDRHENIRRVAEVAKLMVDAGFIVITAFISPYAKDRELAKKLIGDEDFIEIFCDCALAVCEKRDVKGLYKKARDGLISDFTGIDAPYEAPINPHLSIDTSSMTVDMSIALIIQYLKEHHYI
jgi:adenylylsulfate kinase